jgi:hypothetical protein
LHYLNVAKNWPARTIPEKLANVLVFPEIEPAMRWTVIASPDKHAAS